MADENDSERTEEPTQKRIADAVEKGQVVFSREVTNLLMLVVLGLNLVWFAPWYMKRATYFLTKFIAEAHDIPVDTGGLVALWFVVDKQVAVLLLAPILLTVVVALGSSFIQHGITFSSESLVPKLDKISPLKGLERMFSLKSFAEFIKGLIKITLVGAVCWIVVAPHIDRLEQLPYYDMAEIMKFTAVMAVRIIIGVIIVMLLIAIIDFAFQRAQYLKNLRMTRQELKDEYKQSEGDPQIKAKLRQIRMERARRRMMSAVPEADVVVRNPTHYAVALKYDMATMKAPVLLAKGQDLVALRIIDIAEEHEVAVVENRVLARALFENCELDEEIPLEHYQAVAEVIGYVYRLKGKIN